MRRNSLVWTAIVGLLLVGIDLGLRAAAETALMHWYLLATPLILAALRFGFRGAALTGSVSVLVLVDTFNTAGHTFASVTGFLESFMQASTSPEELRDMARQLADLRAADPKTTFARALAGLIIVITGILMLGATVDHRTKATLLLERAFGLLKRYFSPQVIDAIMAHAAEGETGLSALSARKEVTILFADLRGFTALSERLEPEEIVRLLNDYFGAMTEEIFRYEGTLDKYIGDGIMAVFGDPQWQPDHSERAFRAALAMQERMRGLHAYWESQGREHTGMGIGVSTGHAIVGNTGSPSRMEYTAVGSTVNIAARLTDRAPAGHILTTKKTYWRVQNSFDGVPLQPVTVKGFAQPVEIVDVRGLRLVTRGEGLSAGQRTLEIIGRVVDDPAYRAQLLAHPGEEASPDLYLSDEERQLARHVAVLAGYPFFQDIPKEEMALLMVLASVEQFPAESLVVQQGAAEDKFYLILQGDVIVTAVDDSNQERHVASLARGNFFGEMALLFDTPRTASVRTTAASVFLVLNRDGFYSLLQHSPITKEKIEAAARERMSMPFPVRSLAHLPAEVPA